MNKTENIAKCLKIFQKALCLADEIRKISHMLERDLIHHPQTITTSRLRVKRNDLENELTNYAAAHRCEIIVAKKAIREGNA